MSKYQKEALNISMFNEYQQIRNQICITPIESDIRCVYHIHICLNYLAQYTIFPVKTLANAIQTAV